MQNESVRASVTAVEQALQRLRVPLVAVVNNAGLGGSLPIEVMRLDDMYRMMQVNLWGVVHVTRAFLPLLVPCGWNGLI